MSNARFLTNDALPAFLGRLSAGEGRRVLVPVRQGRAVVFAPWATGVAFTLDRATVPPKEAVLPQCETLLDFTRVKDTDNPGHVTLGLNDAPEAVFTVVFGGRPCDARGMAVLDRPYLRGPFADPYYKARRENLVVITRTCAKGAGIASTCFCHWVGSGPTDADGSDILMTQISGGGEFVLEAVTPAGEALLAQSSLDDAAAHMGAVHKAREAAQTALPAAPEIVAAQQRLAERFTDTNFWQKQTDHCLSCGACTYFCPTCYCFNITDEGDGTGRPGKRLRTWDTCMASHFTREASGHNPRLFKALRMRNRVSHKFSNYPSVWGGVYSCNGCGRCITQCPVHLDIRAIVLAAITA